MRGARALTSALVLALVVPALPVVAQPTSSLRPVARDDNGSAPVQRAASVNAPETFGVPQQVRPQSEPQAQAQSQPQSRAQQADPPRRRGFLGIFRPRERTGRVEQQARALTARRAENMVCNDPKLQGIAVGHVGGPGGCGIDGAVRLETVAGVELSTPALMDCRTAMTLKAWVESAVQPVIGTRGGGIRELRVAAHYACRSRNNQRGAKLSEHGKGRAIDISAFRLNDGSEITVLGGWGTQRDGRILRRIHALACGPFGTVLGPESDRFHQDHFHFDTARYRSGSYCR